PGPHPGRGAGARAAHDVPAAIALRASPHGDGIRRAGAQAPPAAPGLPRAALWLPHAAHHDPRACHLRRDTRLAAAGHLALAFRGTFAPCLRASERPMAIACLRLVTFFPERPLLRVPRLRSCMARFTFACAFLP